MSPNLISAPDVIHISEKSVPLTILVKFLFKLILRLASRLDPISFDDLFSSILILQAFLIVINFSHFFSKVLLDQLEGISGNCYK